MNTVLTAACELLDKAEPFVLATIISHVGSTPRTSGSRMIVTADGSGIGTIGGGLLEARAMSRAVELIPAGQSAIVPFDLGVETVDSLGMICGGQAEVLLSYVRPTQSNKAVFERWLRLLAKGRPGWLLTVVTDMDDAVVQVDHCLVTPSGEMIGDWPQSTAERDKVLHLAADTSTMETVPFASGLVCIERIQSVSTAYLFGGGHVALYTARVASMVGFRISVADDRDEFANRERFPDAHEIWVLESFDQAVEGIVVGQADYIIILTRGHLHDRTVLAQALGTDAGYIGMIGSRRKRDAIYKALLQDGFCQADIDRVHSPIGLAIGAETPEEIAVSIVAEMVQHRAANAPAAGS